jgi:hypothetical protein
VRFEIVAQLIKACRIVANPDAHGIRPYAAELYVHAVTPHRDDFDWLLPFSLCLSRGETGYEGENHDRQVLHRAKDATTGSCCKHDLTTLRFSFAFLGDFERNGDVTTVTIFSSRLCKRIDVYSVALLIPCKLLAVPVDKSAGALSLAYENRIAEQAGRMGCSNTSLNGFLSENLPRV